MAKMTMECRYPGCRKKTSLNQNNIRQLVRERERTALNATIGVLCPEHVRAAIDDPETYDLEMTAGEMLAELTVETPRWRFVHVPNKKKED